MGTLFIEQPKTSYSKLYKTGITFSQRMVLPNGTKTARTMIKKPAFAARCLKLVFTYLTGILEFTVPYLPFFIKNKIIKPRPTLPTTKSTDNGKHLLESSDFDRIDLKLDSKLRLKDENWDRISLKDETSIPKRIKPEIENDFGIKNYEIDSVFVNETGGYTDINSQSVRPSSLKFNDSGISDIGSSANSIASTPEIEQNNAA